MKNVRSTVLVVSAVVLCAVIIKLIPGRQAVPKGVSRSTTVGRTTESPRPESTARFTEPQVARAPIQRLPSPPESPASATDRPQPEPVKPEAQAPASEQKATQRTAKAQQGRPSAPEVLQDPLARTALAYVGADPDAEMYWYAAINNPNLLAHERQDLIEDLNEDGLSDPQDPTLEDLPLILSRIGLIEEVGWDAMDEVNADAFAEAYKDLVNLALQVLANG
jgi:hypothetical protein